MEEFKPGSGYSSNCRVDLGFVTYHKFLIAFQASSGFLYVLNPSLLSFCIVVGKLKSYINLLNFVIPDFFRYIENSFR